MTAIECLLIYRKNYIALNNRRPERFEISHEGYYELLRELQPYMVVDLSGKPPTVLGMEISLK